MKTIELLDKQLAKDLTPETLEAKHKQGDFLIIAGLRFEMSNYSLEAVGKDGQQSRYVEYSGYGLTIALNFLKNTIEIY